MEYAPHITKDIIKEVNNLMAHEYENMTDYGKRCVLRLWKENVREFISRILNKMMRLKTND